MHASFIHTYKHVLFRIICRQNTPLDGMPLDGTPLDTKAAVHHKTVAATTVLPRLGLWLAKP